MITEQEHLKVVSELDVAKDCIRNLVQAIENGKHDIGSPDLNAALDGAYELIGRRK